MKPPPPAWQIGRMIVKFGSGQFREAHTSWTKASRKMKYLIWALVGAGFLLILWFMFSTPTPPPDPIPVVPIGTP
jgi:hypothetical protein